MKKIYTTLVALLAITQFSFGQWATSGGGDAYNNNTSGKVGIGTNNPQAPLHVFQNVTNSVGLIIHGTTINIDGTPHYVAMTFDGDYGNATGNYSQVRSYSNLYSKWGSQLAFFTTQAGVTNTLVERMRIDDIGNVGIGTKTPSSSLDVYQIGTGSVLRVGGPAIGTANDASIDLYTNNANNVPTYARIALGVNTANIGGETGYLNFSTINSGILAEKMRVTAGGNVLIGKTSQTNTNYKLDINGSTRANEIVVNTTGADFVFERNYKLPKLSDVKTFIDQNHHLPEIPSAAEMKTNGLELGKMNTQLLQKVEELTLYLIEKDKQLNEQNERLKKLEALIESKATH